MQSEKELEDLYNSSVKILESARNREAALVTEIGSGNNEIARLEAYLRTLPVNNDFKSEIEKTINKIGVLRAAVASRESELSSLRSTFSTLQSNIDAAYKNWIDLKKSNMTPEELSAYVNVGVDAQKKVSLLQSKQFYVIVGSILLLGTIAFILYKKYFSK